MSIKVIFVQCVQAAILLFAISVSAGEEAQPNPETVCTEPRADMCTREYDPVCATLFSGEQKTYSNGCVACSDANVQSYQLGDCLSGDSMSTE